MCPKIVSTFQKDFKIWTICAKQKYVLNNTNEATKKIYLNKRSYVFSDRAFDFPRFFTFDLFHLGNLNDAIV